MDIRLLLLLAAVTYCGADSSSDLTDLMKEFWDWRMVQFPEFATSVGVHDYNDKLTSYDYDVYEERKDKVETFKTTLDGIERNALTKEEKVNYDILEDALDTYISGYAWLDWGALNPVNFLEGSQTDPSRVTTSWPLKTKKDFENYLDRMELMKTRLTQQTALFQKAIDKERTLHIVSVNRVPGQIEKFLVDDSKQFVMYSPFNETLENITDISNEDKEALRTRAEQVLRDNVLQPYREFKQFLEADYMPNTRPDYGVSSWTNGQEYYKACLKWHLSQDITAQEVHDRGLSEVARISKQMIELIRKQGSDLSIPEYFAMLKKDPNFKYDTSEEVLQGYRDIVFDRIEPRLKDYFDNIPDLPLEVRPMAYDGPGGAYSSGSADGSRPGIFWVNVIRPNATNKFDMMALSAHEASPGHHMQISYALQIELPNFRKYRQASSRFQIPFNFPVFTAYTEISYMLLVDLPNFRKYNSYTMYSVPFNFPAHTAYIEGWALYAEYLGEEMGLYKDDFELLGRYSGEIYRACRLVVDTGIHALGWKREEAIEYMLNYTSSDRPDIEVEIDRYITWPGQACAYKFGELKILDLRREAEEKIGDKFSVKEFHTTVLDVGAVPFSIVEQAVQDLIDSHKPRENGCTNIGPSALIVLTTLFMLLIQRD